MNRKLVLGHRSVQLTKLCAVMAVMGAVSTGHAAVIATSDAGTITAFQSGATIEKFDDLSALWITLDHPR